MMKTKTKRHITALSRQPGAVLRPLAAGVFSALSLMAAQQVSANTGFASIPLYLQNKSETSELNIEPNVMLFIDDSGSMRWSASADRSVRSGEKNRLQYTQEAVNAVLEEYQGRVQWGLKTLHNNGKSDLTGYTTDWADIRTRVGKITPSGLTPTTRRYYEITKEMRNNLDLRCRKSYIVVLSDGDANSSCTSNSRIGFNEYLSDPYFRSTLTNAALSARLGINSSSLTNAAGVCTYAKQYWSGRTLVNAEPYHRYLDRNNGLRFFSHWQAAVDFKTSGNDASGVSWDGGKDDPINPRTGYSAYRNQYIKTYTVGFGAGLTEYGLAYLQNGTSEGPYGAKVIEAANPELVESGSSEIDKADAVAADANTTGAEAKVQAEASKTKGFYSVKEPEDLIGAFKEIFTEIEADSKSITPEVDTTGSVSPAVTGVSLDNMVAFVSLDPETWSSEIRFYQTDANGKIIEGQTPTQPSFAGRKVLLHAGGKTYEVDKNISGLNNEYFAIRNLAGNKNKDEWKSHLLPWVARLGSTDAEYTKDNASGNLSQPYRDRPSAKVRNLGDILNSPLAMVGSKTADNRAEFLVTAANDGMVHLFQSNAGNRENPYGLKLSYIPGDMDRDASFDPDQEAKENQFGEYHGILLASGEQVSQYINIRCSALADNLSTCIKVQDHIKQNIPADLREKYSLYVNRYTGNSIGDISKYVGARCKEFDDIDVLDGNGKKAEEDDVCKAVQRTLVDEFGTTGITSNIDLSNKNDTTYSTDSTLAKHLKYTAHESYPRMRHQYMVNGGFTLRQTPATANAKDGQVFMFGSMGQGGRGAYALNVGALKLGSSQWKDKVPMFETEHGENNKLGYTFGSPQIGRVALARTALKPQSLTSGIRYAGFLASGYRSKIDASGNTAANAKPNETALYIYEMLGQEASTGAASGNAVGTLIRKIEIADGVGGLSEPTLLDTDFDGVVDVAYAGDYGGNMYRFDLRGDNAAQWKAYRIFEGTPSKPITAAPAVSRQGLNKYVVIFGTGSDIYQSDWDSINTQSVYGIYEDLSKLSEDSKPVVKKDGDLVVQTLTAQENTTITGGDGEQTSQTTLLLSNNKVKKTDNGWKFDLGEKERVVVKPTMVLRTAVITARGYRTGKVETNPGGADKCIPERTIVETNATTSLISVNAATGGALTAKDARFIDTVVKNGNGLQSYVNGVRLSGIITFTYMDTAKRSDSPVTADGDSGGSGTDDALGESAVPNNRCFSSNNRPRLLIGNDTSQFDVKGYVCPFKRLSWRELFF